MTIRTAGTAGRIHRRMPRERSEDLRGTPAAPGRVTGRAHIMRGPRRAASLTHGDVIVCVALTPEVMAVSHLAAGIVTEDGGVLSSGAIVARESGTPAVIAVAGATTRIRDGQLLTLDGTTGTVTLHG